MSSNILEKITNAFTESEHSADTQKAREVEQSARPPEDEVIHLLVECDGYTWQGHIAGELSWSEAKTSRQLSQMEEEEQIKRYRVGRRNVVCLPDREPETLD